ncbi:hypothetical protein Q5752_006611 [Cryptotrichosporon argae]
MVFVLPSEFPIVGLGLSAYLALNVFQMMKVSSARKVADVKYPNLYASDAEAAADPKKFAFNCAQRAHQNTLENAPWLLASFLYLSLFHPKFATGAFSTWVAGRFFYTVNYASGNPSARNAGVAKIAYLGLIPLVFGTWGVSLKKTYELFI